MMLRPRSNSIYDDEEGSKGRKKEQLIGLGWIDFPFVPPDFQQGTEEALD